MTPGLIQNTLKGDTEQTTPGAEQPQAPVPVGKPPAMTNVPGLPPTGLQQQMSSLNQEYEQIQQREALGAGLVGGEAGGRTTTGPDMLVPEGPFAAPPAQGADNYAQSSLRDLGEKMARNYGLDFSRGTLVDTAGNFMQTPEQLAGAGGDVGTTAETMNYIAQAINDQRIQSAQDQATAALQTGAGLLAKRGRGSLAALQSGFFQAMAANYTNPNLLPEQQNFSFWIEEERYQEQQAIMEAELGRRGISVGGETGGVPGLATIGSVGGKSGPGDVVTTGPHAGQRPVYTYDPIGKTTTTSWENI